MAGQKRRVVIRQADDMGPTPERAGKSEFRPAGSAVRKNPPIDRLVSSGQINAVQYNDALRWRQEFEKAYAGYVDHASDYISPEDGRHDPMTWRIMCMDSGVWLGEIRDKIGKRADALLVWLLIGEMSFVDIGKKLRPELAGWRQKERANALCISAIERLSEVMCEMRKRAAKAKREKSEHAERMEKWRTAHDERRRLQSINEHEISCVV